MNESDLAVPIIYFREISNKISLISFLYTYLYLLTIYTFNVTGIQHECPFYGFRAAYVNLDDLTGIEKGEEFQVRMNRVLALYFSRYFQSELTLHC